MHLRKLFAQQLTRLFRFRTRQTAYKCILAFLSLQSRHKHEYDTRKTKTKTKTKWTKNRFLYYANSTGTRQLQLLSGDISQNPGPCLTSGNGGQKKQRRPAPKCSTCEKTVARSLLEFTRLEFTCMI